MSEPVLSGPWQPLTFGGVAAFAGRTRGRLLKLQLGVALFVAANLVWFLAQVWFPQVDQAVAGWPGPGTLRHGTLEWEAPSPVSLAEGPFLALAVDLDGSGRLGRSADVHLELGRTDMRVGSLLGYWRFPYPSGWSVRLDRTEVSAWWGAWRTFLLIGAGVVTAASLFASWYLLSVIYAFGIRVIAFYADRQLSTLGSVRLAAAALLPGSMLMGLALLLYGNQRLSLLGLVLAWLVHWVIGWGYATLAPFWLPRGSGRLAPGQNPFEPPPDERSH